MAERRCSVSSLKAFDRFIPYRPNLDVDSSYVRLMSCSTPAPENDSSQFKTPVTKSYTRLLSDSTQAGHGSILPIRSTKETSRYPISLIWLLILLLSFVVGGCGVYVLIACSPKVIFSVQKRDLGIWTSFIGGGRTFCLYSQHLAFVSVIFLSVFSPRPLELLCIASKISFCDGLNVPL